MRYKEHVRTLLLEQAVRRYPNSTRQQMLYQIGFLESQLIAAMRDDSRVFSRFLNCIDDVRVRNDN